MNKIVSPDGFGAPLTPAEFEAAIRAVGAERYHDKHPFHKMLHGGKLNKGQVQAWALNRYCYQEAVPRKDAAFMSRAHDRELRREWIHRIHDHDGLGEEAGGIERWLVLTDGLGFPATTSISRRGALPGTKFAVEAYVRFVVEQPLVVAVASSLTELFAPSIHRERIAGMLENYDFIDDKVMAYFKRRLVRRRATPNSRSNTSRRMRELGPSRTRAWPPCEFKCDVLWAQLDALNHAYVTPGVVPPGAFRAGDSNE